MSVIELKRRQEVRRRKRREKAMKTICFTILIIIIAVLLCGTGYGKQEVRYEYHTCERLWDFLRFCPEDMDLWAYIYEIIELNGMDDMTVHPRRLYMIPIYK